MSVYRRLFDLRLGGRARVHADMDREIEAHLDMRIADLMRSGLTPDAARAQAEARFGDFRAARRRLRSAARQREAALRQRHVLHSLGADLRYAMRQASRSPGFTALAVASLAVGIGVTTAMFTLLDHVLLRPLPFAQSEQLVRLSGVDSAHDASPYVSSADWLDWRRASTLEASALYSFNVRQPVVAPDSSLRIDAEQVTSGFFSTVRSRFLVGRSFTDDEVRQGTPTVVVSERLWRAMFNGDARLSVPLRTMTRAYTIVGVIADGQDFPAGTDAWFPVNLTRQSDPSRTNFNWNAVARRRAGVSVAQASAELSSIARAVRAEDPTGAYDYGVTVVPLRDVLVGDAGEYLRLLMGVVGVVLLIVCVNVAAAALARGNTRSREMAVRTSLGAGRARLMQQLLVEHVWLGLVGGGIGLVVAWLIVHLVVAKWAYAIPRSNEIAIDGGVFVFALAASLAAGLAAGIIPALGLSRVSLRDAMALSGRTSAPGRNVAGAALASVEIAMAMLLLTGAGLLIRSFRAVLSRDLGFDTNVALAQVTLTGPRYAQDTARVYAYWNDLVKSYHAIPGVEGVGLAQWSPLAITGVGNVDVAGHTAANTGAVYRVVNEEYFKSLRMPLLFGRIFGAEDGFNTPRVAIVNRTMAQTFWPGENPVGRLVRAHSMESRVLPSGAPWLTVVGVVGDVRTWGLEAPPRAEMYVFYKQVPSWVHGMTALVRGPRPAAQYLPEMRRRARSVDAHVPVDLGTMGDRLRGTLSSRLLSLSLLTAFAAIALLLAAFGVYGVLSYFVAQRTRELAVRTALGARRSQLLALVLTNGLRVVLPGVAVGLAASFWLTRLLTSMLVDVKPIDVPTFAGATAVLLLVSLGAIQSPAWRATRLDPAIALQAE